MAKTKEEAAELLGVSVRTLQRIAQKKQYKPAYVRGKTGQKVATFDEAVLAEWKDDLENTEATITPAPSYATGAVAPITPDNATPGQTALVLGRAGNSAALVELVTAIEHARRSAKPVVAVEAKLTLSLMEAAQLAGLSRNHLRVAITEGKLKARIIGRGFRVKRADLDAYVRKL
jgi:excisionase family DNA binding protein